MKTVMQERRKFTRNEWPTGLAINLMKPTGSVVADSVNFSDGGLCIRLEEMLEVRSLVQLQLTPEDGARGRSRSVQCTGRVAWVIQRLDLREAPPFLFDVGIEFVDPPPTLRQFMARRNHYTPTLRPRAVQIKGIESSIIRGRHFVPRIELDASHQTARWHLIISVGEVPCFSGRYPSERTAVAAWERFKRQQARTKRGDAG